VKKPRSTKTPPSEVREGWRLTTVLLGCLKFVNETGGYPVLYARSEFERIYLKELLAELSEFATEASRIGVEVRKDH
jgi:hypothetical protein